MTHSKGVAGEPTRSGALEVAAPEAQTSSPEVEAGELPQPDAPKFAASGTLPNGPEASGRARGFNQLRLKFEALCKRKGVQAEVVTPTGR